ncbi:hypothetical protein [Roseomonas sp. BN140053]|uniref:hypothetical protein n=1 Tax=Roseomonas sp. BN140053 TaxID=3391898 RepID=UPI0039EAE4C6
MPPATLSERFAIAHQRRRILSLAEALLDLADALDAPAADLEPDHEGEAEPTEASVQAATLAPFTHPAVTIRATTAEQRAAYLATGGRLPLNLRRGLLGSIGL